MRLRLPSLLLFTVALAACGGTSPSDAGDAGSQPDQGSSDSAADASAPDTSAPEASNPEAGGMDAAPAEASLPEAGGPDSSIPEEGTPDTGAPEAGTPEAGADGASGDAASGDAALPPGVQLTVHAANIVDPTAAMEVVTYLTADVTTPLTTSTASFYRHFADDYDFLFFFSDGPTPPPASGFVTAAAELTVNRPVISGIGANRAIRNPAYLASSTRLRAVVGVNFNDSGNGPILHETAHYWGVELSPTFGFGDGVGDSHWGWAGVNGQLGGFNQSTANCRVPATARPPACTPESNGHLQLVVDRFSPIASPGDTIPYSPLELYLMGLVPAAEAGGPYLVLENGSLVGRDPSGRMIIDGTGSHTVSVDQLVTTHGARAPATTAERAFRAAFVVFSAAPVSAARMAALENWAAIVGNDVMHPVLLSFERATGGRATMSTRLGAVH